MSNDLGRLLKAAREERGLTLDQLQDMTKIQKRYIEAIENEKFHLLPGSFYTRAFIRNIADNLQLNTEQLLKQYEGLLPSANSELDAVPRRRTKISGPSVFGKWVTTILLVAFIVLIFSIVYYFAVQNFPPKQESNKQGNSMDVIDKLGSKEPDKEEPEKPTEVEVTPPPEPPKPTLEYVEKIDSTYYYTISNVKQIELTMKAEGGRCWYRVEQGKDKGIVKEKILELGEEETFDLEGLSNVYIRLGHTKAMQVLVNGELLDTSELPDASRLDITLIPLIED